MLEALVAGVILQILLVGIAAGLAALVRCEYEVRRWEEDLLRTWNEVEQWRAGVGEPRAAGETADGGFLECVDVEVRPNVFWVVCRTR
ncbi:MAG: hypothetical protein Kow00109_19640 [Acidobacteriota bacterium]